ncbi:PLC-like phosphodiesterase [Apodospora peruviana]|uniref:PLC-like phosphodiesterase n=1 Tax=Apodospora peruviana TaxID=516989 RepID=A0AAE0ME84_9PEZI|nr:PLC-like phosphodiesterase [Apodospora peruviana]
MGNLTIRNLSITPLELEQVERIAPPVPKPANGFAKITRRFTGQKHNGTPTASTVAINTPPSSKQDITEVVVTPFSETVSSIPAPGGSGGDGSPSEIRITFHEPDTDRRYTASIPGVPSPRSIVMKSDSGAGDKEFTLIYLPSRAFLAIFSSAHLHAWMAELPEHFPLSCLSIPGTHNSPTCHVALPSVRCQAVGVREQLDNGVRFLDIRVSCPSPPSTANLSCTNCSSADTNLALVHSAFPISLSGTKYLHDLLAEVYDFLDANPSETILVSLKREGTGKGTDQHLSQCLATRYFGLVTSPDNTDMNNAADAKKRWYTDPRIPTLGEARGRCVLVRRFHLHESLSSGGLGIDGSSWPDNCADGTCGSGQIRIQDYYEVGQSNDIATKITYAQETLSRAAQQEFAASATTTGNAEGSSLPFFINFLSGSNFFNASCWPEKIAAKINPAIIEHLCVDHGAPDKGPGQLTVGDAGTGIVVTDWVGNNGDWDLIRCIVGWNARLQLKQ